MLAVANPPHHATMATETLQSHLPSLMPEESISQTRELSIQDNVEILTIDGLMRHRALSSGDKPAVSYPSSGTQYVDYTASQLDDYAFHTAQILSSWLPRRDSSNGPSVVALLGPSNFDYLITLLAVSKLGHTVLFLSTRISEEAITSLLDSTNSQHMIVHPSFLSTANSLKTQMSFLNIQTIVEQKEYQKSESLLQSTCLTSHIDPTKQANEICWIIHSSGSTGLPKPIFQTHYAAVQNFSNNMNMTGFITLPLYHAHGISSFFRAIHSSKCIHLYNAELPLTQKNLVDIMKKFKFEIFYGVPYALKLLAETEEGVSLLREFKVVMFGGSACPDSLGQKLVDNDVTLVSHYGSTETGQLMTSFRPAGDKAWDYLRPTGIIRDYLRFEERSAGLFELVCLAGWRSLVASNRPDGAYATKDLFMKHPTLEAYKYFSRLDDTIVLVNGEKANPLSIEGTVREHQLVSEAIVFGVGKPSLGLFIVPSQSTQSMRDEEIKQNIEKTIAAAYASQPSYAHISLDMVKILPIATAYAQTDKGTVIRQAFYRQFKDEIEAAYEEKSIANGPKLSAEDMLAFVRKESLVALRLNDALLLSDESDFFGLGMDSLMATQLRSVLVKHINTGGQLLGSNVVFDNPTVRLLSEYLLAIQSNTTTSEVNVEDEMTALIEKYSQFPEHTPVENSLEGRHIVLTGVTGSLGAHVAAQLAARTDVKTVYCLVRAKTIEAAATRLDQSLTARGLQVSSSERAKLTPLSSNLSDTGLGIDPESYENIKSTVTDVIHCAWSVNFRLKLASFENDCILGTRNLMDLCLSVKRPCPASFSFCSSVSTTARTEGSFVPETLPEKLSFAQGMGYAQSKLVMEHIVNNAANTTAMASRVLRIGQITGDRVSGIWNATEAIPLMLESATTIGALPKLNETPAWLPVDTVGSAVIENSLSDLPSGTVNIVNHQRFHWTQDLLPLLRNAGLNFEEVSPKEWVALLKKSNPDPTANPPIKLAEFFASKYGTDDGLEPRKGLIWKTEKAREWSPTLATASGPDADLVNKMVTFFTRKCWANAKEFEG